jgi:hypothetical protein
MSRHSIELPPDLAEKAAARAAEAGFDTVEQYLEALVRADAGDSPIALDDETLDAIDESEDQIIRGEVLDWKQASSELRTRIIDKHLGK